MKNYKTDVKILRILYLIIIVTSILLFTYYKNQMNSVELTNSYSYNVGEVIETESSLSYEINLDEKYSDETVLLIYDEIKSSYENLYEIEDAFDKIEKISISMYYNNKVYKEVINGKILE